MVSYADFITLLFAFFVVLYGISQHYESSFRTAFEDLQGQFEKTKAYKEAKKKLDKKGKTASADDILGSQLGRGDMDEALMDWIADKKKPSKSKKSKKMTRKEKRIKRQQEKAMKVQSMTRGVGPDKLEIVPLDSKEMKMRKGKSRIEIELDSNILFSSGKARLSKAADPILKYVASSLAGIPNPIRIEGYTDNVPISGSKKFPSNWELSAARAASVVRGLIKHGIDPSRLAVVGYGEFQPIASNDSVFGRRKNRRVVVVVHASPDDL